jgi:transcriptional regulator with XRE-family HTH domain
VGKVPFCERLKIASHVRKLKQVELCEKTGIKKSRMSQYFNGVFEPKQDGVYLLANALNVSEAWLMGYDVPMEPQIKSSKLTDNELAANVCDLMSKLDSQNQKIALAQLETLLKFQENK